eukprot:2149656-Amphidinium_carterae.1
MHLACVVKTRLSPINVLGAFGLDVATLQEGSSKTWLWNANLERRCVFHWDRQLLVCSTCLKSSHSH